MTYTIYLLFLYFSSSSFLEFDINIAISFIAKDQRLKFFKECIQYQSMDRFNT